MLTTVLVSADIQADPAWRADIDRAGKWVDETLGRWRTDKHFSWNRLGEEFELSIQTEGDRVTGRFTAAELADELRFKSKLVNLWRTLSDNSIHQFVERLSRTADEWRKEASLAAAN